MRDGGARGMDVPVSPASSELAPEVEVKLFDLFSTTFSLHMLQVAVHGFQNPLSPLHGGVILVQFFL